jgi:hypothetical protein
MELFRVGGDLPNTRYIFMVRFGASGQRGIDA